MVVFNYRGEGVEVGEDVLVLKRSKSIREFASPETPIFMYDRDEKFVVKMLEEVRRHIHPSLSHMHMGLVPAFSLGKGREKNWDWDWDWG